VLVLDRSRSMDQGFAGARPKGGRAKGTGPESLDYYSSQAPGRLRDSKGKVARQLLGEFAARRPDDRFAMVVFSTLPIRVLGFTQKAAVIQAAIGAGNIGRGLSETNIGLAMEAALDLYADRPYTGSRTVMLVSDGGDRLDDDARERIAWLARKHRVAITWIYLRSGNSPGLEAGPGVIETPGTETIPEVALHRYFRALGTPYRAYEASDSGALQEAIADIDRIESLPITTTDTVPRRPLGGPCLAIAGVAVLMLLAANLLEIRRWA
jgi:mxaC protein